MDGTRVGGSVAVRLALSTMTTSTRQGPSDWVAGALVFGSSAAVLVVEIVALRLLAPYLGLTLETSTLVIGLALAAIAFGSWLGGIWADRIDPRRALAPLLGVSAAVVAGMPFLVRAAGTGAEGVFLLPAAAATIIVPGALLSAVTPMVTKLMLTSLTQTGTIVGRLSGIGTVGAIVGTVITGFVLISRVPITWIMVGLAVLLFVAAVAVALWAGRLGPREIGGGAAAAVVLAAATVLTPSGCDTETIYHCASVRDDPERAGGKVLILDGLRHSYVDVEDPTYLEFEYVRAIAAAIDSHHLAGEALVVDSIGAGGLTLPRYLDVTRPGTTGTVFEVDPGVIAIDRAALALPDDLDLDIRVTDGRLGLRSLEPDSADVVVGDAFGGVSVPWHLTTREAVADIDRALQDDGIYVVNVIDYGPLDFARAQAATLRQAYDSLAVAWQGEGGNLVMAASQAPLDADAWAGHLREREVPWTVLSGAALEEWIGDAQVLTDDYAPVDQLLTPYPAPVRNAVVGAGGD